MEIDVSSALSQQNHLSAMARDALRQASLEDLYLFNEAILGYSQSYEPLHRPMCEFFTKWAPHPTRKGHYKKKLFLVPRGHYKSTRITVGGSLWEMARNPDIRIVIVTYSHRRVIEWVGKIKDHIEGNVVGSRFQEYFGDIVVPKKVGWKEDEFSIRGRGGVRIGPSVRGVSVETIGAGAHCDLIIVDDMHYKENVSNVEQMDKVYEHFRLLNPILDPGGRLFVIGTRWHFFDSYGRIMAYDEREELGGMMPDPPIYDSSDHWEWIVRGAIENGKPIFPQSLDLTTDPPEPYGFSLESLQALRDSEGMGSYLFSCQYGNKPVPDEEQVFRPEFFRFYDMDELWTQLIGDRPHPDAKLKKSMNVYVTLDPAISERRHADYTAICAVGVDTDDRWYVLEVHRGHWQVHETVANFIEVCNRYEKLGALWMAGIESLSFQQMFKIEVERIEGNYPIREIRLKRDGLSGTASKEDRIKSLQPRVQRGHLYLPRFYNTETNHKEFPGDVHVLYRELIQFPKSSTWDCADALEMIRALNPCGPVDFSKGLTRNDLVREMESAGITVRVDVKAEEETAEQELKEQKLANKKEWLSW